MSKLLTVIKHEYVKRVGSWAFVISTVLGPVLMIALPLVPILLSTLDLRETTRLAVVDQSGKMYLMFGKLVGVSLVAFTQYTIWTLLVAVPVLFGGGLLSGLGPEFNLPRVPASFVIYFILFFLIGYYVYATLYALIGAASTSQEEAQSFALPATAPLIISFSIVVPVIRSPNSSFSFWASMFPFFSPITMPVRIITQTPPFWQIALSLFIGILTIVVLVWIAARVYRMGMLMYGKRVSIPEIMRWVRQA